MNERLRVRIPAGAAGEFSSPELTLGAESYWVSDPPLFVLAMDTRSHLLQRSSQNKVNASTPIARILRSQGSQHQSSERDFVLKGDRVYIG